MVNIPMKCGEVFIIGPGEYLAEGRSYRLSGDLRTLGFRVSGGILNLHSPMLWDAFLRLDPKPLAL